ncbi:PadR family transcriptional regulator [Acidaminobacter sp. JC074]|uniref:PadR family transcriptional regulator n=1 Tax=Acidaminobacter sp. JC074 TaxID=2530199 RepID=UPI001F1012B7|nr:PadR family transcriptional regulator [Acidaminobacter sp. JC074]MCH4888462.1 PadR family transcriptional regulator [Acidaminobacter sp. JC074]
MNAQLKKGVLDLCMLKIIKKKDCYGYEILKMMKTYFPEVDESTFYSVLRRLNKDGSTEVYTGEVTKGPKRKYYRLTEIGKERLVQYEKEWKALNKIIDEI